jgi:hypothetical protein
MVASHTAVKELEPALPLGSRLGDGMLQVCPPGPGSGGGVRERSGQAEQAAPKTTCRPGGMLRVTPAGQVTVSALFSLEFL